MPRMDGWEASRQLRAKEGVNQLTPIIAVTANAMSGDRGKCIACGMDDYIPKPVSKLCLFTAVDQWKGLKHGDNLP